MPNPVLGHLTARQLLHYDGRTGALTWRVTRGRLAKAGQPAGATHPDGTRVITIKGRTYTAIRIIWLYVHGAFPAGQLTYADTDKANLRLANIVPLATVASQTPLARYQRARRAALRASQPRL